MTKIQAQLEKSLASARALVKTAGEDCDVEKGKPEALIDGAADVQVVDNLPEGVTVPGSKGMEVSGETSEDRGTDIGTVETNGPAPENNEDNPEVKEIINATEHVTKHANALIDMAQQILAIPDSSFAGVAKTASAGVTEEDVLNYIVKQANAGDPAMQGIINYCHAFYKLASDEAGADESDAEVEEGADIEAAAAEAQEIVAQTLMKQDPELSEEEAMGVAADAVAETLSGGGEGEGDAELDDNLVELIQNVAEEVQGADPSISDDEAAEIAIQAVSEAIEEGGLGAEEEGEAEEPMDKEASAEDTEAKAVEDAGEAAAEIPAEEGAEAEDAVAGETAVDEAQVAEMAKQLVGELAEEVKSEDPSISDEEAIQIASEAVEDAMETVQAQQMIGATDEQGNPVVSDEDAAAITDELEKSASANPCRALLCTAINNYLGLSPAAFAARIGA